MKKIVAVTGSNGFIGSQIVQGFEKFGQYQVLPVARNTVNLLSDEEVLDFFAKNKVDTIIHCASTGGSRKDNGKTTVLKNNLRMFFNLERCLKPGMTLINLGSGAQYNKNRNLVDINEEAFGEAVPQDEYGFGKYIMSKYINQFQESKHTGKIYNLVLFGVYGKGEDYTYRFISNAIIKNLLHMPIVINQNVLFHYLYIDDLVRVLKCLLEERWDEKEFNVTPRQSISLIQTAEIINDISDYHSEIIVKNRGMNYQYTGNNQRLMDCIGEDFQFTSYEEGIRQLYFYYKERLDSLDLDSVKEDAYIQFCKNT